MKKPLTALDFCYQGEPENISVLECISLCVLVVAYDSGTRRARQMLTVMEVRDNCYHPLRTKVEWIYRTYL